MSDVMGVVLCGGKSKRFPHKLYLTDVVKQKNVVIAACEIFTRQGLPVTAVCNVNDRTLIRMLLTSVTHYVFDDYDLSAALNPLLKEHSLIVLCGDNTYGIYTEMYINNIIFSGRFDAQPGVCVNTNMPITPELDFCTPDFRWHRRGDDACTGSAALTTPWLLPRDLLWPKSNSIVDYANEYGARPICLNDPSWSDLGTPESVAKYYENH